ncbi:MAG: glycoside hydrolase family 3 C-terminal domain-containing protein [Bacteroidales bacterium]
MKRLLLLLILSLSAATLHPQPYPFRDTGLDDEARLDNLISLMTLDEKINCLSTRPSVQRLGIGGTRIVEGLHGLALSGPANWAVRGKGSSVTTTFPQAIGLAQMWDPELLRKVADLEAEESRWLTQNPSYASAGLIVLAPNADLGRDVRWGRTEECYGEDAFLAARLTVAFVQGLQGDHPKYWKTASLMKHFLANSNENNRAQNSSDFNERLFREYYSYPFFKGVTEGGSRAYMTAYNRYNGIPCTVHPVLKDVTVNEWGQNGIIATDGGAYRQLLTHHKYYPDLKAAAKGCLNAGTTMFLDNYRDPLREALREGLITEAEIDRAIRGNLRVMLRLGLLDSPDSSENPYLKIGIADTVGPWKKDETMKLARTATSKSVVLLKNDNQTLPLRKESLRTVAVIGPSANLVVSDWYSGTPPYRITALQGIRNALGSDTNILFAASNKADSAVIAAREADVAIVCVGNHPLSYGLGWGQNLVASDGREDVDRQALSLEQEDLVKLVYAANRNTVLVIVSSFPYTVNWSADNIPAIVHISQSSQELGNGLADVLFGEVSPAGRLVLTWPSSIDQLPPILEYDIRKGRTYMYSKAEPLFPFGHGLTYTTFEYSSLKTDKKTVRESETVSVTLNLKNTGNYDSDEVVQLYASFPGSKVERPAIALKGFSRVHVGKGREIKVTILLDSRELEYWDIERHAFVLEKGKVILHAGASSADLRLKGEITIR